jgi:predicted lipoprotein with Yx(FWY)xxD motif
MRLEGRRRSLIPCYLLGLTLAIAACGVPGSPSPATRKQLATQTVSVEAARVAQADATVLVNGAGDTLYMFVPDHQGVVTCTSLCAKNWPPFTASATSLVKAGSGVDKRLVGTVALSPDRRAVTYNRWPLYTYHDDVAPGMSSGQGIDVNGGYWYLMSPSGDPVVPAGDPKP